MIKRLIFALLLAGSAYAQQLFVMPMTQQTNSKGKTYTAPAYANLLAKGEAWQAMPLGAEPICLFAAMNPTQAEITAISASPGVTTLPSNLTLVMSTTDAARATAFLEANNIPGSWVQAGMTWLTMLRYSMQLFQFMQRYNGVATANGHTPYVFHGTSNTLNTLVNAIPSTMTADLQQAATSLGYTTSGITGSMTVRQALIYLGQQWPMQAQIQFGGMVF
jgi:hypothetical protein